VSDGAPVFGLIGALEAFPRRLAARAAERSGGRLTRGTGRGTTHAVFGRRFLMRAGDDAVAARAAAERAAGRALVSERGLLRRLDLAPMPEGSVSGDALAAQSGLSQDEIGLLALFDAFERDAEPFTFRDVILARKYAGLIAGGARWGAIARSIHRAGPPTSLTAKALQLDAGRIRARDAAGLCELDGQALLDLGPGEDADTLFADAEWAEASGDAEEAAALYARCLALDPTDAVAAYNLGNCLREMGQAAEAEAEYLRALRHDPALVEAWFNLAALLREGGRLPAARRCLERATAADPAYADAVFNLAAFALEAGDLTAAEAGWRRYLALDAASEWARTAERGLRYIAELRRPSAVG
jgi:tetratricopeptide (TPR) repeat protein